MFKFLALLAIIAITQARPADEPIAILKSETDVNADGSYSFLFEGADGSFREEKAIPKNVGTEDAYLEITGTYRYVDKDGQNVEVHYTADDKGFIPSGTNIPEDISKAARLAAEHAHDEPKKH
ncbi:endocuticle structural protein SgAbd-6-like [Condylostylus longicornis]|uniref:endocuticle structural protein SgAbd-6-like n=1 Tax=Condylostylus longicornis TaxID=2530218 RepID=UPI00244DAB8F|nr:endocuticle structural protein SgAbd-6-like [Condylostylus longicornis]